MVAIFQSWRLRLRDVEVALKVGRLDDAFQMLTASGLLEYFPAQRLAERLTLLLAERAKRRAGMGDAAGGWRDLELAAALADLPACDVARRHLVDALLNQVEMQLARGSFPEATQLLDQLEQRAAGSPRVQLLRELARSLQAAHHLARRGKFGDAENHLGRALGLRPEWVELEQLRATYRRQSAEATELSEKLYRALSETNFREAVRVADQLLALAPEMKLAQNAREKAWRHVGADLAADLSETTLLDRARRPAPRSDRSAGSQSQGAPRFVLWVDGVGGYLVCLGNEIVLGQAATGNDVDVPVLGDLSRQHARIRRSGEGYVLDPWSRVRLNGKAIAGSTALCDGDELELGTGVKFRFRRPHALSASARLEPISRHRTDPYSDGVLLMAESCVLGPRWSNHIVCRDWSGDVVLSQTDGRLYCRSLLPLEIDGAVCEERGQLGFNSRIVGADFSMSLEELDRCLRQPLV